MHKKSGLNLTIVLMLVSFLLFGFVNTNIVLAADITDSLGGAQDTLDTNIEKAENIKDTATSTNWTYLAGEWKNIILKNEIVSALNTIFSSFSFVFMILFGMPYSFSLTLLIIIILWFYFFIRLKGIFKGFSPFSSGKSLVIALGLAIALAQLGLYKVIADFLIWLVFLPKSPWFGALITMGIIFTLIIIASAAKYFEKLQKMNKEEFAKEMEKSGRGVLHTFVSTLTKAWK